MDDAEDGASGRRGFVADGFLAGIVLLRSALDSGVGVAFVFVFIFAFPFRLRCAAVLRRSYRVDAAWSPRARALAIRDYLSIVFLLVGLFRIPVFYSYSLVVMIAHCYCYCPCHLAICTVSLPTPHLLLPLVVVANVPGLDFAPIRYVLVSAM